MILQMLPRSQERGPTNFMLPQTQQRIVAMMETVWRKLARLLDLP